MQCAESDFRRRPVIATRSGYTGEIGYELFTYEDIAVDLRELLDAAGFDGKPCGCGAHVLRLGWGTRCTGRISSKLTAFEPAWAGPSRWIGTFRGALARQRDEVAQPLAGAADARTPASRGRIPGVRATS
jgi:glycine cleavage system aminomethyltransferase T